MGDTSIEQGSAPEDDKVTSLLRALFDACSDGTDKLDINQFSHLLTQYEGSITAQQVAISFDSLTDSDGKVAKQQFISWAAALFSVWWGPGSGRPDDMIESGLQDLVSRTSSTAAPSMASQPMPQMTPSAVMKMAEPVFQLASVADICSALQAEVSRETKVASVVRALGGVAQGQTIRSKNTPETASYMAVGGSLQLDRPCLNMCQAPATLFLSGLRAPVCRACAAQLVKHPIMKQAGCKVSSTIPRAPAEGAAAVVASAIDQMSALELQSVLHEHPQLLDKFKSSMLQLVLPTLLPKPVQKSGELFKLSTKQKWLKRRFVLDARTLRYYDEDKECRVFELQRITSVRKLYAILDAAAEGEEDFQFAVNVSPTDAPATEQVFRASSAEEQLAWLKAIHCNVCLIPADGRAMPELMPCSI